MPPRPLSRTTLLTSISALVIPLALAAPALAADGDADAAAAASISELVVTATRRDTTIQDTPVNIAAVGTEQIAQQGFSDLGEITRFVPGIFIVDQGARQGNNIVVRGLNATALGSNDGNNDGGGTVATYLGDIPLFVDLKLNDIDRVEFLLGPQGTLYGAGTLGGAVRYIPVRPKLDELSAEVRGDLFHYTHAHALSTDVGATVNAPIGSKLAFRASFDSLKDSGFIDQPYLVQEVGVSNPNAIVGPAAYAANLMKARDVNTEKTLSGRAALRWQPSDKIDINLTYYYQRAKVGGRQVSGEGVGTFPVPVGQFESVLRVKEPNRLENQLLALEGTFDLGFADLTSSSGYSEYKAHGHRDQTDLLIALEYSYEAFPSFTAFTEEKRKDKTFTQEVRLVSTFDSPLSFILGGFYDYKKTRGFSKEYTPHYDEYLVSVGVGTQLRPDSIEYYSPAYGHTTEAAGFGEVSYKITEAWQITGGARYYHYDTKQYQAVDIPLFSTVTGRKPVDLLVADYELAAQKDNGWLYKLNTSYKFSDDVMVYGTYSEGYRIGNSNGVALCPTPLPGGQIVCAQPNELQFTPDKTQNYELGVHSQWFDKRLTLNVAAYYIKWKNPQVDSATKIGLQGITINGGDAESKGFEVNASAAPIEGLTLRGSYAHNHTRFTEPTLNLVPFITPPGFQSTLQYANGADGDRLPGSPIDQGSFYGRYERPFIGEMTIAYAYGFTAAGNVLTRAGRKGGGVVLPAYVVHNASVEVAGDSWTATLYVDNLFDTLVKTGVRNTPAYNQVLTNDSGGKVYQRGFFYSVLAPRRVGIRYKHSF